MDVIKLRTQIITTCSSLGDIIYQSTMHISSCIGQVYEGQLLLYFVVSITLSNSSFQVFRVLYARKIACSGITVVPVAVNWGVVEMTRGNARKRVLEASSRILQPHQLMMCH